MKNYLIILLIALGTTVQAQFTGSLLGVIGSSGGASPCATGGSLGNNVDVSGWSTTGTNNIRGQVFTPSEDIYIQSLSLWHNASSNTSGLVMGVYSDNAGQPLNLLATTNYSTDVFNGWNTLYLTNELFVSAGTSIWLIYGGNSVNIMFTTNANSSRYSSGDAFSIYDPDLPSTLNPYSTANFDYGIYASYTCSPVNYSLDNISYDSENYSFVADITTSIHINWSNQGEPIVGSTTGYTQYDYTQTDKEDITTLSKGTNSYGWGLTSQANYWMDGGSDMLAISNGQYIRYRTASTPYNLTTLSGGTLIDLNTVPNGLITETRAMAKRGGYWYILSQDQDKVYQYQFADDTDASSTLTLIGSISIVANGGTNYQGVDLSPDGKTMLVLNTGTDTVDEWALSTPWLVATATYVQSTSLPDSCCGSVGYNSLIYTPEGSAFVLVAASNETAYQFNLNNFDMYPQDNAASIVEVNSLGSVFNTDGARGTLTVESTASPVGSNHIKIENITTFGAGAFNVTNLVPGRTYKMTFQHKATSPHTQRVSVFNLPSTEIAAIDVLQTTWTESELSFTAVQDNVQVWFYAGRSGSSSGDALEIDGIKIH